MEENYPTSCGTEIAYSDNHVIIASGVECNDAHVHDVDDLHPLIDHDVVNFLRDSSSEFDILDNDNIQAELSKY